MGFPSPATDYEEHMLTPEILCHIDANCQVIETDSGYAVINKPLRPADGDVSAQFAVWMGGALKTEDGEAIEGDALDSVTVRGVLTFTINRVREDDLVIWPSLVLPWVNRRHKKTNRSWLVFLRFLVGMRGFAHPPPDTPCQSHPS